MSAVWWSRLKDSEHSILHGSPSPWSFISGATHCRLMCRHSALADFPVHVSQKKLPHFDFELKLMLHRRIAGGDERYVPLHLLDQNAHFFQVGLQIDRLLDGCTSLAGRCCFRIRLPAGLSKSNSCA